MSDVVVTESQTRPVSPGGDWSEFAEYVRAEPACLGRPAEDLAEQFGLDEHFVRSFLAAMRAPVAQESFLEVGARAVKDTLRVVGRTVRVTFTGLTARPWICLIGTIAVSFAVYLVLAMFGAAWGLSTNFVVTGAAGAIVGAVTLLGVSTQAVCYYRHAQVRYALAMTVLVFAGFCALMFTILNDAGRRTIEESQAPAAPIMLLAAGILSFFYFLFAVITTLMGSYAKYRQDSRQEGEVTRQELLDRLFEIDNRISQVDQSKRLSKMRWVDRLRTAKTFYLNVLVIGFAIGMFEVAIFGTLTRFTGRLPEIGQMNWPVAFLSLTMIAVKVVTGLVAGFVAGRPGRSMSALTALLVGTWLAYWFPLGSFGPQFALSQLNALTLFQDLIFVTIFGSLTGYAAQVEDRSYRQNRLSADDLPTLLAEQIQLQWRLGLGQQATTVMVVDVAKSTMMKANADPLKIEWSFREYQTLVDDISRTHGGHVFSTAGDGAVVGFPRAELAVLAAREILTGLPKFNMRRNRLDIPFRLRVGIHSGHTESNLADAPFNEVIDIAAHIEAAAPIGGIALSSAVAESLDDDCVELAEMARQIDGQQVFVVLNPMMES